MASVKNSKNIELYRGKNAGVFAGANGYYAAQMASDGQSHYQETQGNGWSDSVLREQNRIAKAMDTGNYSADEEE